MFVTDFFIGIDEYIHPECRFKACVAGVAGLPYRCLCRVKRIVRHHYLRNFRTFKYSVDKGFDGSICEIVTIVL